MGTGLLVSGQPGVYRVAGSPVGWPQSVLAACLSAGPEAVASHRAAAVLWGLRGVSGAPVEITIPGTRRPELRRSVVVHRAQRLDRCDVSRRGGIPLATPALTLLGLAAVAPDKVEMALEDALLRGLVSMPWLAQSADRLGGSGRRGAALLQRLVTERDPDAAPTESVLEDVILQLLREAGLPEPVRQFRVGRVRIDLAYPAVRLGIEADSRRWHGGRLDVQRNSAKANLLVRHGWRILHFGWADARDTPAALVECVDTELRRRGQAVG